MAFRRIGPVCSRGIATALVAARIVLVFHPGAVIDVITALESSGYEVSGNPSLLALWDADAEPLVVAVLVGFLRAGQCALVEAFAEVEPVGGVVG